MRWTLAILATLICLNSFATDDAATYNRCLTYAKNHQYALIYEATSTRDQIYSEMRQAQNNPGDATTVALILMTATSATQKASKVEQMARALTKPEQLQSSHRKTLLKLCAANFETRNYILGHSK